MSGSAPTRELPPAAPAEPSPPRRAGGPSPRASASWGRRRQLATDLRTIAGRAYPRVIGSTREPSWVFFEILLPFLTTSAFVFVYRALHAPSDYIGFVVLGGAMLAFWSNVIWSMGTQL